MLTVTAAIKEDKFALADLPIVQALRALAHMSRDNDDMQLLTCLLDCILACIQDIIEYLVSFHEIWPSCIYISASQKRTHILSLDGSSQTKNKWAYIYVGLYGFGYMEAGRNVIQLFQQKGWTVIISDDLCDRVLFLVSLGVGLISGLLGLAMVAADPNLLADLQLEEGTGTAGFM